MSNYASHSIKADRVNFLRQTNLDGADVNFNTNGNFNFTKPVNTTSLIIKVGKFTLNLLLISPLKKSHMSSLHMLLLLVDWFHLFLQ